MKVAFRIDDVTTHMDWDKFDRVVEIFNRYDIKPLIGIIPNNRDPELLQLPYRKDGWERIQALNAKGWPTAQHGYQHVYTTCESGLLGINDSSEFAGIDYETQYSMLSEGKKILEESGLGTNIFMAPAHSYDLNTLEALRALGFKYVTDGYSLHPYMRNGLKFIPCQTAVPRRVPFGLQTVCLHPNTMKENTFLLMENWLQRNRHHVCDYEEAIQLPGRGCLSTANEKIVLSIRNLKRKITQTSSGELTECISRPAENENVVLFTSNYQGGVFQFTLFLAEVIARQGHCVHLFLPDNAECCDPSEDLLTVHRYRRFRNVRPGNKYASELSMRISECLPRQILFCDDTIISEQVMLALDKKNINKIQIVHDVSPHPIWFSLYEQIRIIFAKRYRLAALKRAERIIMLSKNSFEKFKTFYPKLGEKADYMLLGAHVPGGSPAKPPEISEIDGVGYYLFFGRIDKYKGIINLLKAYETLEKRKRLPLVVAGGGSLQDDEKELVERNDDVLLISRFLDDAEMLWLIQNALTVVLPYTEASQSGVLPLAYHFGVPVITSNVQGLTEFVEDGESGIICPDVPAFGQALLKMQDPDVRDKLSRGALSFSRQYLNWDENVKKCLKLSN